MVGPGARKPSVGEGIESRRPLFCSAITTLHSLFIYLFVLSFIFTFASILVCVNNNNITRILRYSRVRAPRNFSVPRPVFNGCTAKVAGKRRWFALREKRRRLALS